jgi:hypothetical protein
MKQIVMSGVSGTRNYGSVHPLHFYSIPPVKKPQNMPELPVAAAVQFFDAEIIEVEPESLRAGEHFFCDFVEAGDVFVFPVLEEGRNPEGSGRTVDQVNLRGFAARDEKVPPFKVAVSEAVRVQGAGGAGQLTGNRSDPRAVFQAGVAGSGQMEQIIRFRKSFRDHRSAPEERASFFLTDRNDLGAGDPPVRKVFQIFPFSAQPGPSDPAAKSFPGAAVEFDVKNLSSGGYPRHPSERAVCDRLPAQSENGFQ